MEEYYGTFERCPIELRCVEYNATKTLLVYHGDASAEQLAFALQQLIDRSGYNVKRLYCIDEEGDTHSVLSK